MANKIRDIFSDDMYNIEGKIRFRDEEAHKKFLSALDIVQAEGRVVPVEGITSLSTKIVDKNTKYPIAEDDNIIDVVVGPSIENVSIPVLTRNGEKNVEFGRYFTNECIILEAKKHAIVWFKFIIPKDKSKHRVSYKVQFQHAQSIEEVVDEFELAEAFLSKLYKQEDKEPDETGMVAVKDIKKYFATSADFLRRLVAVEQELGVKNSPCDLADLTEESRLDVEELYLLLCKKQIMRLNAKLTASDSTMVEMAKRNEALKIGDSIKLTFTGTTEYTMPSQKITLHTANLLQNAIIKDIQTDSDKVKILYGDTDSKPMYISFSAFKTQPEAKQECEKIIEHEDLYINAQTVIECIRGYDTSYRL